MNSSERERRCAASGTPIAGLHHVAGLIHLTFLASALAIAATDRLLHHADRAAAAH